MNVGAAALATGFLSALWMLALAYTQQWNYAGIAALVGTVAIVGGILFGETDEPSDDDLTDWEGGSE